MVENNYCPWSRSYEVRIRLLDEQHRAIFDILSKIFDCINASDPESAKEAFAKLISEKTIHYATEEDMLKRCGYPGFAKQKADHAAMLQNAEVLLSRINKGIDTLDVDLLNRIRDGFREHISGPDQAYAEYLRLQGIR